MKRLEKFTHSHVRSLIRHLENFSRSRVPETIHKIRVDIKKIKSIIQVLGACTTSYHQKKDFRPFRKIFRLTGDIRDTDVLNQMASEHQVKGLQGDRLLSSESFVTRLETQIPDFVKRVKRKGNKLESVSGEVDRRDFSRYLQGKKKQVKSELFPLPQMSGIHGVRKDIKEVLYLSQVNGKSKSGKNEFYDKMQDLIGKLHDKQVLVEFVKAHTIEMSQAEEEMIKSACEADEKEIIRLATDFYKQSDE
jgi:CHAD domain-containing protein